MNDYPSFCESLWRHPEVSWSFLTESTARSLLDSEIFIHFELSYFDPGFGVTRVGTGCSDGVTGRLPRFLGRPRTDGGRVHSLCPVDAEDMSPLFQVAEHILDLREC
jgi:hypothetical protein